MTDLVDRPLDALFAAMRRHLERHGAAPELALASPPGGENVSVVAPVPAPVAERLAAAGRAVAGGGHLVYEPVGMHMTVLNLDPWRRVGGETDALVDAALAAARRAAPFGAVVRGLNLAPGIVFAQVLAPPLRPLRLAMVRALDSVAPGRFLPWGPALAGEAAGHVTVVRFTGPVDAALLDAVAARREVELGRFAIDALEVVRSRGKTPDSAVARRRVALGSAG